MNKDYFKKHKNTKIRFRDSGKGRTVVLLHGFLERLEMWEDFESVLNKNHRVISIDLLGHGETESAGYIHTMDAMADYVKAVLNHLKLRKYVLIGHSMGGYVSLALAEKYPDNILGLCLFHSTSISDSDEKKKARNIAIINAKENHKSFIRKAIPNLFRPINRKLYRNEINIAKKHGLTTSKRGVIAALEGMKVRPDREVLLNFTHFPKLMVIGKFDKAISYESSLSQSKSVDNLETSIHNCAHMSHIEDRDTSIAAIENFLNFIR